MHKNGRPHRRLRYGAAGLFAIVLAAGLMPDASGQTCDKVSDYDSYNHQYAADQKVCERLRKPSKKATCWANQNARLANCVGSLGKILGVPPLLP